jgi:hypothetical protein
MTDIGWFIIEVCKEIKDGIDSFNESQETLVANYPASVEIERYGIKLTIPFNIAG